MHCVVGVLTSPLHVLVWAPTRSLLSRRPYVELTGYFDRTMGRVGLTQGM